MSEHDTDAVVERIRNSGDLPDCVWAKDIRQILSSLKPGDRLPGGLVCVPEEPTEALVDAVLDADLDIYWGYRSDGTPGWPQDVYRIMIAAAGDPA